MLSNLLNPKLTVFFFVFLLQFVPPHAPHELQRLILLSGVFMAMTFVVFVFYGVAAAAVRHYVIERPKSYPTCPPPRRRILRGPGHQARDHLPLSGLCSGWVRMRRDSTTQPPGGCIVQDGDRQQCRVCSPKVLDGREPPPPSSSSDPRAPLRMHDALTSGFVLSWVVADRVYRDFYRDLLTGALYIPMQGAPRLRHVRWGFAVESSADVWLHSSTGHAHAAALINGVRVAARRSRPRQR